ncbi:MAG TPA: glycosyltransferase family 2 protein [Roseimicrobium sp.]|nr:glycosyltransferase family 2 protein [Roseimicrobium sp.]
MNDTNTTLGSVSVVIPAYNRASILAVAIRSALGQGAVVGEVVVVDDGSKEDLSPVIESSGDPRVRMIRQSNSGPAVARNRGWRAATCDHVMFLDSDDALEPGAVGALLATAATDPGSIPFGRASVHGQTPDSPAVYDFAIAERSGDLLEELAFYHAGTILAALYPRRVLEELGGFGEGTGCGLCEDYEFGLRLALHFKFHYLPRVVYRIRMHDDNRHRPQQRGVWECHRDAADKRLAEAGEALLRLRVMAYFEGLVADLDLKEGNVAGARARYLQCLRWWPVKLGAWKGLLRCLKPSH